MKKISIKIIVPEKGKKWTANFNGGTFKRNTAIAVYNHIERRLTASSSKAKIYVYVNYDALPPKEDKDWFNDGEYIQKKEALYALACFMEEFIDKETLKIKYAKYG